MEYICDTYTARKARFKLASGLRIYRGLQSRRKSPPGGTERDIRSHSRIHRIFFPTLARFSSPPRAFSPRSSFRLYDASPLHSISVISTFFVGATLLAVTCADLVMFPRIFRERLRSTSPVNFAAINYKSLSAFSKHRRDWYLKVLHRENRSVSKQHTHTHTHFVLHMFHKYI